MKNIEKKIRQHYVFQFYLKSWTTNDKIFSLLNNKIIETKTDKIGLMKNFYKLNEMSKEDFKFIDLFFFKDVNPITAKINKDWAPLLNAIFEYKNILKNSGNLKKDDEFQIDIFITNLFENFHANIENAAIPCLKSLLEKNFNFLNNDVDLANFLFFISIQYFRTKRMKEIITNISLDYGFKNFKNIWNVCSIIFATNIGASLFIVKDKLKFTLLTTNNLEFITGDQPIINTFGDYKTAKKLNDKELQLYYPLSPNISLLISLNRENEKFIFEEISDLQVHCYNALICKASYEQLYSNKYELLEMAKNNRKIF